MVHHNAHCAETIVSAHCISRKGGTGGGGWCHLRLEVDLSSVLESELGQKWRYSALKACVG